MYIFVTAFSVILTRVCVCVSMCYDDCCKAFCALKKGEKSHWCVHCTVKHEGNLREKD